MRNVIIYKKIFIHEIDSADLNEMFPLTFIKK